MSGSSTSVTNLNGKCFHCKKKSYITMNCSCTKVFCMKCRLPEVHECTTDYKEKAKERLVKENPIVVGEKVIKI